MVFHGVVQDIARLGLHGVQNAVIIRYVLLVVRHGIRVLAGRLRLRSTITLPL